MKLRIWTDVSYPEAATGLRREVTRGQELIAGGGALDACEVAFGQPRPEAVMDSPAVRWVHLDSAGYERYDASGVRAGLAARGLALTTSSSVYREPCAEHLLAMITGLARGLPAALDAQRGDRSWPMHEIRRTARLLAGQTVVLLGYGAIARRLAEMLAPLGMTLVAVRRRRQEDALARVIAESELGEYLPLADHLVSTLPANAETRRFVNAARLGALKPGAVFYNIGRGSTVDQEALIAALASGRLGAAYLDVTDPEPLPPGHPLWAAPNCYITPHSAGGYATEKEELVRHFGENLRRFVAGAELIDRVG